MKYASFRSPAGVNSYGRVSGDRIVDLGAVAGAPADLKAVLQVEAPASSQQGAAAPSYLLSEVALLPPIPNPGKILCVGLNYETHRKETGRAEAAHPSIFTRFADTLIAHGQGLVRPRVSADFDYEGELAVIIGKGGRRISAAAAHSHIAGYSCFNDASVRDWQRHNIQFTPGKNFPATGAFGPWLVTPDEAGDLAAQRVTTRLNGQVVQDQPISDMLWPVAEIIEYISAFTPLAAAM